MHWNIVKMEFKKTFFGTYLEHSVLYTILNVKRDKEERYFDMRISADHNLIFKVSLKIFACHNFATTARFEWLCQGCTLYPKWNYFWLKCLTHTADNLILSVGKKNDARIIGQHCANCHIYYMTRYFLVLRCGALLAPCSELKMSLPYIR